MQTPQSQGQTTHKETPKLFRLRGTLLEISVSSKTLPQTKKKKFQGIIVSKSVCHFYASWHAPYLDLPHILTMGRDEILQQTRFKALKCNHPKKALSTLK
ncbi:hypothetical protein ACLGB1_01145 [Helicobacter pylori]